MNEYNFTVLQGSEFNRQLIFENDDGSPINLAGYKIKMQFRRNKEKTSLLYDTLTTENGRIIITDAAAGEINFNIPSSISDDYEFLNCYYDLELIDVSLKIHRKLQGVITIDRNVTD
jgi:hypothetical protein